jgi:hypothetical protein
MKSWGFELVLWIGIAFLSALGMYLLLLWCARLPEVSIVSFGASCKRMCPFDMGIRTFVIVLTLGAILVFLRKLRRRAIGDHKTHGSKD